jgi:hypothetical protein
MVDMKFSVLSTDGAFAGSNEHRPSGQVLAGGSTALALTRAADDERR